MRLIHDPELESYYVCAAGSGARKVSSAAGRVLREYLQAEHVARQRIASAYPQFLAACDRAGWLTNSRVIDIEHGPHLKRVQIEVSLRCNLQCSYCYSTSGPNQRTSLSTQEVLSIIQQSADIGALTVDFTGGEFFLDPEWRQYLALAKDLDLSFTVHSNGTVLSRSVVDFLAHISPEVIQVSVDSHIDAVHDSARGARGALARTLRGLDRITAACIPLRISLMVHRGNVVDFPDTLNFFRERYPSARINVDRIIKTGGALDGDLGLSAAEFWDVVSPLTSSSVSATKVCESASVESYEPDCGMAYSYVYLTASGEVAACPTMTSREHESFRGPSIRESSLSDAWYRSDFFNSFRFTNCENVTTCESGGSCGGGCRSNAYVESGYVTAPDLVACNSNKNSGSEYIDFLPIYRNLGLTARL